VKSKGGNNTRIENELSMGKRENKIKINGPKKKQRLFYLTLCFFIFILFSPGLTAHCKSGHPIQHAWQPPPHAKVYTESHLIIFDYF
jgi:hypothetical protein